MNVRPVVFAVVVVGCTILGWIIGRQTLLRVDNESGFPTQAPPNEPNAAKPSEHVNHAIDGQIKRKFKDVLSIDKQIGRIKETHDNIKSTINSSYHKVKQLTNTVLTKQNIQDTLRKISPLPNDRLQVYSHNGKSWAPDPSICKTNENFIKASLRTSEGYTPIYIHEPSQDKWISRDIQLNGNWEGGFVELIFSLLKKDKDLQFIDLGANIGVFALSVAKLGRQVIAVEPLSINLKRFCKSIEEGTSSDGQPFTKKVTLIHNALSDERETVKLGKDLNNVGGTFVLKDSNEQKVQGSAVAGKYDEVVMTAKLDDLLDLPNFNFKKVILKIDVEGYETKAFNGGRKFFDTVDVQAVLMEWRWHSGAKDLNDLLKFFVDRGYTPYNPKPHPPQVLQVSSVSSFPGDVLWLKS